MNTTMTPARARKAVDAMQERGDYKPGDRPTDEQVKGMLTLAKGLRVELTVGQWMCVFRLGSRRLAEAEAIVRRHRIDIGDDAGVTEVVTLLKG